jgi:hypothetical protein
LIQNSQNSRSWPVISISGRCGIQKKGMCQTHTPLRLNWAATFSGVKKDHSSSPSPDSSISAKQRVLTRSGRVAART